MSKLGKLQVGLWASSEASFSLSTLVCSSLPSAALSSNVSTDGHVGLITPLKNLYLGSPHSLTHFFCISLTLDCDDILLLHSPSQKQQRLQSHAHIFFTLCY